MKTNKRSKVTKVCIEAVLLSLIENTEWREDKVIHRVATMFEIPATKVAAILAKLDF